MHFNALPAIKLMQSNLFFHTSTCTPLFAPLYGPGWEVFFNPQVQLFVEVTSGLRVSPFLNKVTIFPPEYIL
jgi:hypothetical protein